MNGLGVSTACFYPDETELALSKIIQNGIDLCELFINSPSELAPQFITEIKKQADAVNLRIRSLHPFSSFAESFFLFSSYRRRFTDTLPHFDYFFHAAAALGAEIFVVHGIKLPGTISDEEYYERFSILMERGKRFGVSVCQENVVHFRSEDPSFLSKMAKQIGEDFGIILDVKQARRANRDYHEYLDLAPWIRHVHLSDFQTGKDCVPPGEGDFNFQNLFLELRDLGYKGDYMIELYRDSFTQESQILKSYEYLKKLLP